MRQFIIGILGIVVAILTPVFWFIYNRWRRLKHHYEIFWKKSSSLKPEDILGNRPFNEYYYFREEDNKIRESLRNKKNVLIIGPPLSGKSRAVYQALISLDNPYEVIIPKCIDINLDTFPGLPPRLAFWRPRAILFDDLHRFVERRNFEHLLNSAMENNIVIIANCCSEMEYEKTKNIMLKRWNIHLETIFENIIELGRISKDIGKQIAEKVGKKWDEIKFDGTIGSIFMPLSEMERRFNNCTDIEKTILRAMRDLYISGIYEEANKFLKDHIKILCTKGGLKLKNFEWIGWFENLKKKEFVKLEKNHVQCEEVYLKDIVKPEVRMSDLDVLKKTLTAFPGIPDALIRLGNKAYDIGIFSLEKANYMKIAIKAYEGALRIYTLKRFPMDYAITQNNLGNAYGTLAEVENKAENCKKAIRAFEEALKVYTPDRFPMDYAMTQNNLGNAYIMLAEVENKAENCKKAIRAFEEALKVFTPDRLPIQYATTQNNLGNAYITLAQVENKAENCKKAIRAFEEALKVFTPDRFPIQYATTQNNLGNAYGTLAQVENKAENCKKAIRAFEEALKVFTPDRFPIQYATTQNNLGNAYGTLAQVENKAENCKKAIEALEEALKVRTLDRFPIQYATTQNNLGNAYGTLAQVENKAENCKKAIRAFEEALKVRTLDRFPIQYATTQNNLGNAYRTLAEVENKAENCKKAIKAYEEALKVFTKEEFPEIYPLVKSNFIKLREFCKEVNKS